MGALEANAALSTISSLVSSVIHSGRGRMTAQCQLWYLTPQIISPLALITCVKCAFTKTDR